MMFCVLAVVAVATICHADVPGDEIKSMPGLSTQLSFRQYSGYLQASGTRHLHYWFVESQGAPSSDPVVLWLNGGPGCSSDLGLLTENGPFRIKSDGKTVMLSNTSWNMHANMLFLEAPAGVGFSYSDDKNYTTDDNQVAMDNHLALRDFFNKFSEFSKHQFFITGESYGGVYVPTLSSLVVDDTSINFQGFAVGNGLLDDRMNDNSLLYFAYYHGLIGDQMFNDLNKFCCNGNETRCFFTDKMSDPNCGTVANKAANIVYGGELNIYNLYAECAGGALMSRLSRSMFGYPFAFLDTMKKDRMLMKTLLKDKLQLDPPCIDASNVMTYLNTPAVRDALHIPPQVQKWTACSGAVGGGYVRIYTDMSVQFKKILDAGKRVLVYNGDIDMACNFLGDEWFTDALELQSSMPRKEWFYMAADGTKQVAGFVKTFDKLSLVTIRGAGHMVPTDRPIPGFNMFNSFIQAQSLA